MVVLESPAKICCDRNTTAKMPIGHNVLSRAGSPARVQTTLGFKVLLSVQKIAQVYLNVSSCYYFCCNNYNNFVVFWDNSFYTLVYIVVIRVFSILCTYIITFKRKYNHLYRLDFYLTCFSVVTHHAIDLRHLFVCVTLRCSFVRSLYTRERVIGSLRIWARNFCLVCRYLFNVLQRSEFV